jgi:hypothetical protein
MGIEWEDDTQASNFTFLGSPEESGNIYRISGKFLKP